MANEDSRCETRPQPLRGNVLAGHMFAAGRPAPTSSTRVELKSVFLITFFTKSRDRVY